MHSNKSATKPKPEITQPISYTFEAIGTHWTIEIFEPLSARDSKRLLKSIRSRIEQFDQTYSRFRADSLVTAIAARKGRYTLPEDAAPLLHMYEQLYRSTGGQVTPLIGKSLADAGYDAQYSLRPRVVTRPPKWEDVMKYDPPHLITNQPILLDFGAAGKGYLVDIISNLLEKQGMHSYCIDAGGDMLFRTPFSEPLNVGLEHPDDASMAVGVAHLQNQSLCGSAGNRRAWGKYHHIISPRTLASPEHIRAVWVVAKTALLADGLTTALFFTGPDHLMRQYEFEYAIVNQDYSLEYSPNFPGTFYTNENEI